MIRAERGLAQARRSGTGQISAVAVVSPAGLPAVFDPTLHPVRRPGIVRWVLAADSLTSVHLAPVAIQGSPTARAPSLLREERLKR
jgi:hypothetical protein